MVLELPEAAIEIVPEPLLGCDALTVMVSPSPDMVIIPEYEPLSAVVNSHVPSPVVIWTVASPTTLLKDVTVPKMMKFSFAETLAKGMTFETIGRSMTIAEIVMISLALLVSKLIAVFPFSIFLFPALKTGHTVSIYGGIYNFCL
jgi:hypothetical protein